MLEALEFSEEEIIEIRRCKNDVLRIRERQETKARPEGLEPSTPGSEDQCSIQLSYGRKVLYVVVAKRKSIQLNVGQVVNCSNSGRVVNPDLAAKPRGSKRVVTTVRNCGNESRTGHQGCQPWQHKPWRLVCRRLDGIAMAGQNAH